MEQFKITKSMEKFIALQRTGYGDADIARCYFKDILKDFDSIKAHLPEKCNNVLDIGCGIGGIDAMIHEHYSQKQFHDPFLNMFDFRTTSDEVYYGYRSHGAVYNSLELTAEFLTLNGVKRDSLEIYDAHGDFIEQDYDLIISLLSCGFHYPVETYLSQIKKCNPKVVILDIRKHSNQMDLLKSKFASVEVIAEWGKCERVLLK